LAPARTPAAIVARLNAAINEGLSSAEAKASLEKFSALPQVGSPDDFARFITAEAPKWAELVKMSGTSVQ
jgi:tripartite-type tricarboxylate transporter receptor subunit TctC